MFLFLEPARARARALAQESCDVEFAAAVLLEHLEARREHFVDRQNSGAQDRAVFLALGQDDAIVRQRHAAANRGRQGFGARWGHSHRGPTPRDAGVREALGGVARGLWAPTRR